MIYIVNTGGVFEERTVYLSIHDTCADILRESKGLFTQALLRNIENALCSACVLQSCMFERM